MNQYGKTIQIFMPDGSPTSIKIADITTRIIQLILVPRNKLNEIADRKELNNVGVYFLFGKSETEGMPPVQVGFPVSCFFKYHDSCVFSCRSPVSFNAKPLTLLQYCEIGYIAERIESYRKRSS